jgi:hypothetical protein
MALVGAILSFAAPLVVQFMKWRGYSDAQIESFLKWCEKFQREAPESTLPASEEAAAKARLFERCNRRPEPPAPGSP